MTKSFSQLYLRCQLIGWSSVLLNLIGINYLIAIRLTGSVIWYSLIFCLAGLLTTHLLRSFIRRRHYRELPIRQALPRLLLATMAAAVIGSILEFAAIRSSMTITQLPRWLTHQNVFVGTFQYLIVFIPWTIIYYFHFYIILRRKLSLEDRQLQLLLKEKELSAAEPPVDIDFLTSSLDRIRSLIDQDPDSARSGINTFSNILRKGRLKTD
jgi:hypothetical protein